MASPEHPVPRLPEVAGFILRSSVQGRWYLANGQIVPVGEARRGRWGLGACHANARWLALRWPDHYYRWWTGHAVAGPGGTIDNHSWVCRADGSHLEVAYEKPAALYLGVPMPAGLVAHASGLCTFHPNECVALAALGAIGHGAQSEPSC